MWKQCIDSICAKICPLHRKRREHIRQATQAFLQTRNSNEVQHHIEMTEILSKLISLKPLFSPFWVFSICLLVLFVGMFKKWDTEVAIEVEMQGLTFKLVESIEKIEFSTENLSLQNVTHLPTGIKNCNAQDFVTKNKNVELEVSNKKNLSVRLGLLANSKLSLQLSQQNLNWTVKYGSLIGQLDITQGDLQFTTSNGVTLSCLVNAIPPETLRFQTIETKSVPISLATHAVDNFSLLNMSIDDIHFEEENPSNSGRFTSLLLSGKVRLLETNKVIELKEADVLRLSALGMPHKRMEMSYINDKDGQRLKLVFEGRVGKIDAGTRHFLRDLRPTLLEYFYHNETLGFFATIFGLLWTFGLGIQEKFFH